MKNNADDKTYFVFNLIAFVSAGRSVTFVMQHEFTKVGPFAKWYSKNVDEALRNEEVPKCFRNLRNVVLKKEGNPRQTIFLPVFSILRVKYDIVGSANNKEEEEETNSEQEAPPPRPTITDNPEAQILDQKYVWYVEDIRDKTKTTKKYVIPTCEEYLKD